MSVIKLFPTKDATLYSAFPVQNTGLDEIIEVSTTFLPNPPEVSRFLIQFSTDEIEDFIDTYVRYQVYNSESMEYEWRSRSWKGELRAFIAEIDGLPSDVELESYPISQTWNMGTGKYNDIPKIENGCSWKFRLESGSGPWIDGGLDPNESANYPEDNPGGGTWFTGSIDGHLVGAQQKLDYASDKDIKMDVTNTLKLIWSGTIDNNGHIVKQFNKNEFKASEADSANIKYFSIDTHTIYPPHLDMKVRDAIFSSGSNTIINTQEMVATLAQNQGEYRRGSIQKFYINCRPQFPERTFSTDSDYNKNFILPQNSYYAIKDLATNEFIIDFDEDFTQISADSKGSYFTLYMNGLEPERYYQVLIKTTINGTTLILDDNYYFKVING